MAFSGVTKFISNLVEKTALVDDDNFVFGAQDMFRITVKNLKKALGIDELNTNIGGGAALGPKMKSGTASYRIIGKMCFVTVETTPSSALVQGDVIISGIPAPLEEFYLSLGAASGNYSAYMKMAGTVIAYYPGYAKTERIDACFCYPVG